MDDHMGTNTPTKGIILSFSALMLILPLALLSLSQIAASMVHQGFRQDTLHRKTAIANWMNMKSITERKNNLDFGHKGIEARARNRSVRILKELAEIRKEDHLSKRNVRDYVLSRFSITYGLLGEDGGIRDSHSPNQGKDSG
jgi:hypothetical protein